MSRRLLAGLFVLTCAGLLFRATTVEAADGKQPAAKEAPGKDVFGATKVWAIHLEIPVKEYEAMQPPAAGFGPPGVAPPAPKGKRDNLLSRAEFVTCGVLYNSTQTDLYSPHRAYLPWSNPKLTRRAIHLYQQ